MNVITSFAIDEQWFAVDILLAREIVRPSDMTPVPLAPPAVRGLMGLRGQIITVLDLGCLWGQPTRVVGEDTHVVVLKTDEELAAVRRRTHRDDLQGPETSIGLLVDRVGDVHEVGQDARGGIPANIARERRLLLRGMIQCDERSLLVLSPTAIVAALTASTAKGA